MTGPPEAGKLPGHQPTGLRGDWEGDVRFAAYAEVWLAKVRGAYERHALERATVRVYSNAVTNHLLPVFAGKRLVEITPNELRLFFSGLFDSVGPSTITIIRSVMKMIFEDALRDDIVEKNPVLAAIPDRWERKLQREQEADKRAPKSMTAEQMAAFLKSAKVVAPHYYPMFLCWSACLACRFGEMAELRRGAVDLAARSVRVEWQWTGGEVKRPKRKKTATLEIPAVVLPMFERICAGKAPGDLLFPAIRGGRMGNNRLNAVIRQICAAAQIPTHFSSHSFRHNALTRRAEAGASLHELLHLGRHSTLRYVEQYTKDAVPAMSQAANRAAAEIVKNSA